MSEEFEMESEVRDLNDKRPVAAPSQDVHRVGEVADETSHTQPKLESVADGGKPENGAQDGPPLSPPPSCKRERCCHTCSHSESSVCDIAGEVCCSDYALTCDSYKEEVTVSWAPEIDWLLGLIDDKGLLRLRDAVKFRQDDREFYLNPACKVSCATMEYIMKRIDVKLKWRRVR